MSYENRHAFNDGKILLYTRNGNPTYQARLSIPGLENYVVKSTKRTNLMEARAAAEILYNEYWYKARNGLETGTNTFETLYKRWLTANTVGLSDHRLKYITGTARRYLLPYFGKYAVSQISDSLIEKYWDWRRNLWASDAGKERINTARRQRATPANPHKSKLGNVATVPANKSLSMEQTVLRQIFAWAVRTGTMTKMPHVKVTLPKQIGVGRRPAFTVPEFLALREYLRKWAGEATEGDNLKGSSNPVHIYHRRLLRNYVLFMQASGLRPNEARQLRWRDMTRMKDRNGREQMVLSISPSTKTGARLCVPLHHALSIVDDMKKQNARTEPEDFVFSDRNSKPIENFGKTSTR
ncbi:MAG: phage integrase family protein [Mesorhizobium sp.]|nr:MAG: phage integrase family protein [Mesorhizobium sp.]